MVAQTGTHIPGIGHLSKKEMMIGGIAAGGIVLIALYRNHENSKAAAAAAAAVANSNTSGSGSDIDPSTGLPAGSPEDIAALEGQTSYADNTAYGYTSGAYDTGYGTETVGYTSNAQWAQAAEEYLTNYAAGDAATVSAALGAYLTGSYVTATQYSIIEQAIAYEGAPPQSGTNGYPPAINTTPPSTGTTGTTTTTTTTGSTTLPAIGTQLLIPFNVTPTMNIPQIAAKFGISVAHLLKYNPGKVNPSPVGTSIIVPFEVKSGMTVHSIAQEFGIADEHLEQYL
jgi:LysM repeat protein